MELREQGGLNAGAGVVVRPKLIAKRLNDDGKYPGRNGKNAFRGVWLQTR
jgi:hypothetical protein